MRRSRRRARYGRRVPAFASYPHRGAAETKISIDGLSQARHPMAVLMPTVLMPAAAVPLVLVPCAAVPLVLVPLVVVPCAAVPSVVMPTAAYTAQSALLCPPPQLRRPRRLRPNSRAQCGSWRSRLQSCRHATNGSHLATKGVVLPRDLAIDLGTANTLVYERGRGIVFNEPSVIALNERSGDVLSVGREAWQMIGRTPSYIIAARPLRHGAITDFDITQRMIRLILQGVGVGRFGRTRVAVCVPSLITPVERRAVIEAARRAGASDVRLIEQPIAAAIGSGLPIHEPTGSLVIDIGGGTAEVAMVSLGGMVSLRAVRVGSFDFDTALMNYSRRVHGIAIGERTAEELKISIGSAWPIDDKFDAEVKGRDLTTGLPRMFLITPTEVRSALADTVELIVEAVLECLGEAPPELAQDLIHTGALMVGGGSLLRGLDQRIASEARVPVLRSESPLETVVLGAGRALENFEALHASHTIPGR